MKFAPSLIAVIGVTLAVAAFCTTSNAQDERGRREGGRRGGGFRGPGGGGGGDPISGLLRSKDIQEELKITDEQIAAIKKLSERNRLKRPEGVDFREMSEEDRSAFFQKMQKQQAERMMEMKEQLEEVLLPTQIKRAEEIALQAQGVRALNQQKIAEKLGMTEEQQQQVKELQDSLQQDIREKMREMLTGGHGVGVREKMMEIRKEMEEKVLGVLTLGQKATFEEMKGEPFKMPERMARGGGRGGDAGRGGQRGGRRGKNNMNGEKRGGKRDRPESQE
jgi:hypothetical protein